MIARFRYNDIVLHVALEICDRDDDWSSVVPVDRNFLTLMDELYNVRGKTNRYERPISVLLSRNLTQ